jgi:hypothetical protein
MPHDAAVGEAGRGRGRTTQRLARQAAVADGTFPTPVTEFRFRERMPY